MNYHIITIFPDMLTSYFAESIISSAIKNKIISVNTYALREYTTDKHRRVDGKPFAGGPGMVMWVDPIVNCIEKIKSKIEKRDIKKVKKSKILFVHFVPSAEKFTTNIAKDISKKYNDIIFICGRYEGVDSRVNEIYKGLEISIGDYVLTGGELPAMVMIDSISRQIDGVLNKIESLEENRVSTHKIYARPEVYEHKIKTLDKRKTEENNKKTYKTKVTKYSVPKVLLSGNHKEIEKWKLEQNML